MKTNRFIPLLGLLLLSLVVPALAQTSPGNFPYLVNNPVMDVRRFGAKGDGVTDDRLKVKSAVDAVIARGGGTVLFPKGTWNLSKYVYVPSATGILFRGENGATIKYASDDAAVVDDATTDSTSQARSAFYVKQGSNIKFEGLHFLGSNAIPNIDENLGAGVYATQTTNIVVDRCSSLYGSSIFKQDALTGDTGARITNNYCYGQFGNLFTGPNALVAYNHFELGTGTDWDRPNPSGFTGSTHACYLFAGRENVRFIGNFYKQFRETAIKGSGSALPIRNILIQGNQIENCGAGVVFGADDYQAEHGPLVVNGNTFKNVGTVAYSNTRGLDLYGCKSATISNNQFYYTHNSRTGAAAGMVAIYASRYAPTAVHSVTGVATTAGSNTVTASGGFITGTGTGKDTSRAITIRGAGANSGPLHAVVLAVASATSLTLDRPAITTVASSHAELQRSSPIVNLKITGNTISSVAARPVNDASIDIGVSDTTLTSTQARFTAGDIGTSVSVTGAGHTTAVYIVSVTNATTVVLSQAASSTVTNVAATVGGVTSPSSAITYGIHVAKVGQGADDPGSCEITGNTIAGVGSVAIIGQECVGLRIEGNSISNVGGAVEIQSNRFPVVRNNVVITGAVTSSNWQVKTTRDSFPLISGNYTSGRFYGSPGRGVGVTASGGSATVIHPFLGDHGLVEHANAFSELVMGYGTPQEGDQITLSGTASTGTYTYKASAPGAFEFNSPATLIALIEADANYTCADYGTTWGVTTDHIRIRRATQSTTANQFQVVSNTQNPTSLVILRNGSGANYFRSYSRGEGTTPGNTVVIWSPWAQYDTIPFVQPNDDTFTATSVPVKNTEDGGACMVVKVGAPATTPSTEAYQWALR